MHTNIISKAIWRVRNTWYFFCLQVSEQYAAQANDLKQLIDHLEQEKIITGPTHYHQQYNRLRIRAIRWRILSGHKDSTTDNSDTK